MGLTGIFFSRFVPLLSAKKGGVVRGGGGRPTVLPWHCLLLVLGVHSPPGLSRWWESGFLLLSSVDFVWSVICLYNVLFLQLEKKINWILKQKAVWDYL